MPVAPVHGIEQTKSHAGTVAPECFKGDNGSQ